MDTTSYQVSHITTACTVPGMIPVCCTHHPPITHNKESQAHLRQHTALDVSETASSSHKRKSSSTTTIETTTGTPQQQHSSRDSSRGGGDLTSPATALYVPDFKNTDKRQTNQDLPIQNIKYFPKIRSHNGRPLFLMQLFLEPQNYEKKSPEITAQIFPL